jgi:hypothetical protein
MRASIDDVEDERLRVLMSGLRGSNMNADDFASADTRMNLVCADGALMGCCDGALMVL